MNSVKQSAAALFALVMILMAGCGQKVNDHVVDYAVDIPAGFQSTEMDGVIECWVNADGANINVNTTDKTRDFNKIDADMLRDALMQVFQSTYSAEPTITDRYFTSDEVCGLPAYQYCYNIELDGTEMTQLVVCVNADKTYTFTYTDVSGDWMDEFEDSVKNIRLIIE